MNSRTSFALTAAAMLLSASLVMAQGSTPAASGSGARTTKPVAGAVTKAKTSKGAVTQAAGSAAATTTAATTQARTTGAAAQTKATKATTQAKATAGSLVDLNSASKADLMALPGVGEAISAKIIAGRPWANKGQLLAKGLLGKAAYDKLSPLVIAKQGK